ncbi:uncharacterized protein LOC105663792 [Megachile rotundata]|uniref:uncharacterized protein LOC105663792 n=1 Tax=Megachile rotundata TaxID=143995 RepID=UPI003FD02B7A
MRIALWNARSVRNKIDEVRRVGEDYDMMAIVESWLCPEDCLRINGWQSFRRDSGGELRGGGIIVLIRDGIEARIGGSNSINEGGMETMSVMVRMKEGEVEFVIGYRRPSGRGDKGIWRKVFGRGIIGERRVFLGDWNAKNMVWNYEENDVAGEALEEVLEENELVVLNYGTMSRIGRADQRPSNLDLIIANGNIGMKMEIVETGETMGSDHQLIKIEWEEETMEMGEEKSTRRFSSRKIDQAEFLKWLLGTEDQVNRIIGREMNIDQKCDSFTKLLQEGLQECVKGRRGDENRRRNEENGRKRGGKNRKERRKIWWDAECERVKEERRKATIMMRKKPNEVNWNRMIEANKRMEEVVKAKKKESWEEFIKGIRHSTNIGILWKRVKALLKCIDRSGGDGMNKSERVKLESEETDRIIRMCGVDGEEDIIITQEDRDGTERERIEVREKNIRNRIGSDMEGRYSREFSEGELERAIRVVKLKTAPGEDGIEFGIIKKLTKGWRKNLLELFNEVWRNGRVPTRWKETRVKLWKKWLMKG